MTLEDYKVSMVFYYVMIVIVDLLLTRASSPSSLLFTSSHPTHQHTHRTPYHHPHKQYTAHATARGQGRNGLVESSDDVGLKLRLAMPRSLGGKGDGQNPEQLFAMGYAGTWRILFCLDF